METHPDISYKRYLFTTVLAAAVLSLPMLANLFFIKHAHEIDSMADIVRLQIQTGGIYGAALVDNTFRYKLELVRQKHPDIVALGSSKIMSLRHDAFTTSFVNAGGGMKHLNEGRLFLTEMLSFHIPKILILGVDPVWFNAAHLEPFDYPEHQYNEADITREKLLAPFGWLFVHKISWNRYVDTVLGRFLGNDYTTYPNIGFMAIETAKGFNEDGARFYGSRYRGEESDFNDVHFGFTQMRLNQRCCEFESTSQVDPQRYQELMDILKLCDQFHIKIVLFLTPAAPSIDRQMRDSPLDYGYADELDKALRLQAHDSRYEYHDFRDIRSVQSNDCECVDGSHAGSTAYYRFLRQLITQPSPSILSPYLDLQTLNALIQRFQGKTLAVKETKPIRFQEVDFLQLGCKK